MKWCKEKKERTTVIPLVSNRKEWDREKENPVKVMLLKQPAR